MVKRKNKNKVKNGQNKVSRTVVIREPLAPISTSKLTLKWAYDLRWDNNASQTFSVSWSTAKASSTNRGILVNYSEFKPLGLRLTFVPNPLSTLVNTTTYIQLYRYQAAPPITKERRNNSSHVPVSLQHTGNWVHIFQNKCWISLTHEMHSGFYFLVHNPPANHYLGTIVADLTVAVR